MIKSTILTLFLLLTGSITLAQSSEVDAYLVRVVMTNGGRLQGVLADVDETALLIDNAPNGSWQWRSGGRVPLALVRKIVLKRASNHRYTLQGAIIGGLLTGLVVVRSARKSPFRSPTLYGINLVMGIGGGAATGALLGHAVSGSGRRVIRPLKRDQADQNENLRRRLLPFTYRYQQEQLNYPQP
ncbi:hypothetical protein [Fibrisoma limi]|uniref:hypothetical protein n=1 Tax=Fibrisoma limi TaxID=663275 RepID=UPI000587A47B|nr:hypothetical protein [Fibrisoma limi]